MGRTFRLKTVLLVSLLAAILAGNAMALTNAKSRPDQLVFPNVVDDAGADTYSPLIFSFVGGAILVAGIRTLAVRLNRRHVEEPAVRRTLL